jgi:PPK2 family polyphosphate:nucleotide phosphotransferase
MIDAKIERFRVEPGTKVRIKDHDPAWVAAAEKKGLSKDELKARAQQVLEEDLEKLRDAQQRLYADDRFGMLVILQGMDASGKDSTIKHVMSGLNPQGCHVFSFKQPSTEELQHDFLWRYAKVLPERGRIGIFNRSYFEEVLVVRVHAKLLDAQKLPADKRGKGFWEARYEDINAFERHLVQNGITVLKFFLNISREEQRRRFLKRLEEPEKYWKFSPADIAERAFWDDYMEAYEDALTATSTERAPWYIVPADHKWFTRAVVANILTSAILALNPRYPEPDAQTRKALAEARQRLQNE